LYCLKRLSNLLDILKICPIENSGQRCTSEIRSCPKHIFERIKITLSHADLCHEEDSNGMKNVDKQYPEILATHEIDIQRFFAQLMGLRFAYSLFFACKTIYMLPIYRPRIHIVLSIKILRNNKIK